MKRPVTFTRRLVQLLFFATIMWGAYLWPPAPFQPLPKIETGYPRTTLYPRNRILWVSGQESVLDLYLPSLACRFAAKGGFFKSCSLHMISENLTWRSAFRIVLPHVFALTLFIFLFSRMWCGWACPLGVIQDAFTWLRRRFSLAAWEVHPTLFPFFYKLRHFFLWLTIGLSAFIAFPVFGSEGINDALFLWYCQICPARIVYPLVGGVKPCYWDGTNSITIFMSLLGFGALAFFLFSFMVPRLWCRVCAVGGFLSYFNRGSLPALEKSAAHCTSCGVCRRVCPVDIEKVYRDLEHVNVTDGECLLCLRCVEACPERDCLAAKLGSTTIAASGKHS
jgi:ferredoxin-type protein NapH